MLNNFIYAQTKELFLEQLNAGNILDEAIVFIEDSKEIWNRGHYFGGPDIDPELFSEINTAIDALNSNKLDIITAESTYAKIADIATIRSNAANGNNAWASYGTATSVVSVPIDYKIIKCTISAAASFTLASVPPAGREIHVLVYNSGSADVVVSLPVASPYVNFSGDSLTIPAGGYAEINVISDGSTMFIRHAA